MRSGDETIAARASAQAQQRELRDLLGSL